MNTRSLLFLAIPLFLTFNLLGQKSGKNDIDLGILTQGEFYIFDGTRQFYLFGDYRRSYRNFFAQCRVTYTSKSYGGRIGEYLGIDTNSVTYLWLEAGREDISTLFTWALLLGSTSKNQFLNH